MQFVNGKIIFNDKPEMIYNLISEMELFINREGYLCEQESGNELLYNDKHIKPAITTAEVYAGKNDVLLLPWDNYNLTTRIFSYYLQKLENEGSIHVFANFIDDLKIDENSKINKQRVVVRTNTGDIYSDYFYKTYLAYLQMIFILSGTYNVDLSNFDEVPSMK